MTSMAEATLGPAAASGRVVHVNGALVPEAEARVSVFDRGFLMADGVYEVVSVLGGKLIDFDGHMVRLKRSLSELAIANPLSDDDYLAAHRELLARNDITDGLVYLQVTRGNPGDRDFAWSEDVPPTVVMFTQAKPGLADSPQARSGIRVVTLPDLRWSRRDIKTVQLLYPSLAKMEAKARGADDAWLVERAGGTVRVVESAPANLKVTTPHDLALAESLLC